MSLESLRELPMQIMPSSLSGRLEEAYGALWLSVDNSHAWINEASRAKIELATAKQAVIAAHAEDPKKLGGNEAAREAAINAMCSAQVIALQTAEESERLAKNAVELATIRVNGLRAQLRILEVAAGMGMGDA